VELRGSFGDKLCSDRQGVVPEWVGVLSQRDTAQWRATCATHSNKRACWRLAFASGAVSASGKENGYGRNRTVIGALQKERLIVRAR
jgi:hypothetical protein